VTKQEEIREGIRESILRSCDSEDCGNIPCDATCPYLNKLVDDRLHRLHSQGVVLRVEKELPSVFNGKGDVTSALEYKKKLAGYGFFEALIEEKNEKNTNPPDNKRTG